MPTICIFIERVESQETYIHQNVNHNSLLELELLEIQIFLSIIIIITKY